MMFLDTKNIIVIHVIARVIFHEIRKRENRAE